MLRIKFRDWFMMLCIYDLRLSLFNLNLFRRYFKYFIVIHVDFYGIFILHLWSMHHKKRNNYKAIKTKKIMTITITITMNFHKRFRKILYKKTILLFQKTAFKELVLLPCLQQIPSNMIYPFFMMDISWNTKEDVVVFAFIMQQKNS